MSPNTLTGRPRSWNVSVRLACGNSWSRQAKTHLVCRFPVEWQHEIVFSFSMATEPGLPIFGSADVSNCQATAE